MDDTDNRKHTDEILELPSSPGLQKVVCPPEHFISVASQDLARALSSNVDERDRTAFAAFVRLVEATSQFEFLDVRNRLKKDFQPFAAGAARQPIPLAKREEPPTEEFLDQEELDFVCGFDALMEAAHYSRLSKEEWETAEREEFTFTMPVEVDWSRNDTDLLGRFWDQHQGQQEASAEISDRILVFHRGIDTATASGLYIAEKIDLLVAYLIAGPLSRLLVKWFPKLGESQVMQAVTKMGDGVQEAEAKPVPHQLRHKYAKVIYRTSLERQMPDTKTVFSKLFSTLQLSEPQFKSVVVLFRQVVGDKEQEAEPPEPEAEPERMTQHDKLKMMNKQFNRNLWRRNIHIKRFESIPIADTELIFPEKNIFLKPVTILQLTVTIVGGLIAAFVTLWGSKVSMNAIMSIVVLLGGRASQVYFSANMQRQAISDAMTKGLYEKTRDSQEGVLFRLLEEMTDQHVKESLLAYIVLLTSATGRAISDTELDKQCEAYLAQRFGQRLDFDISGSLRSLLLDGVVWRDSQGLLTAVPLEDAVAKLNGKWAGFFRRHTTGLAASAEGEITRNTRLARITERRTTMGAIPEAEVDREKMDQLFAANSYGSEDRHNGSQHDYPRVIEPVNQRAIEPVNIGPPSAASGHHSPASSSPGSVHHKKRISTMFKQFVPGHHGGSKAIKD